MKKNVLMRCDPDFLFLTRKMKNELQGITGERVSDRQITKNLANFIKEENIDTIIRRRAQYRKTRGGFF